MFLLEKLTRRLALLSSMMLGIQWTFFFLT
jgi:hypothetical protein